MSCMSFENIRYEVCIDISIKWNFLEYFYVKFVFFMYSKGVFFLVIF